METKNESLAAVRAQLAGRALPRWQELPDLELYMDQVLALAGRYLGGCAAGGEKGLTAAMVNNYVKSGAMPAPEKKRYTRTHLAHLLMICLLKPVLPIASIRTLLARGESDEAAFYDRFCALFEEAGRAAAAEETGAGGAPEDAAFRAALRAQAEQALATALCPQ